MSSFDKRKAEPDVIDNREASMADVLNVNLQRIDSLDISSGYFEVGGYGLVRKALEEAVKDSSFAFRLLVGKDAIRPPRFDTFEQYREYAETERTGQTESMKSGLDGNELNKNNMDDVTSLIRLLGRENVQVRHNDLRFNHAKCYILGQEGAVVGSSNFTRSGLLGNDELNTGVYSTTTWEKVKAWYERMWNKAEDAKDDILQALEQSKFGAPPEPYDLYLKILFEKYKRILTAMAEKDTTAAKTLAKFQTDAVSTLLQIIDEYGGAVLADSTGLGKTHVGLEVIRQKMLGERKKVLLIAPAQVRDTVWAGKLETAGITVGKIGMEELGREDFDVYRYKKYDFVVIDESQNFRSKTANRRLNLMKIMSLGRRKQALLLSATPINNSIMDLYYQISIITGGRDDYFTEIGIPDLYQYMRKAANHAIMNTGLEKIQQLLDAVMVRRTRTFIREVYPDGRINDRPITFPKREYAPIRYGITELFGNVYEDLFDTIKSLHMVPYGIEKYNTTLTPEERQKARVLAHLQVILLLKRFESSVKAVGISIDKKIALFEYFEKILAENKIVSPKQLNKIMLRWNARDMDGDDVDGEEDRDRFFMEAIKRLNVQDAGGYDVESMRKDTAFDLAHLRRYRDAVARILPFDKKMDAVSEMIRRDGALERESKKVLIFTEYTDTAAYIKEMLRKKFPDKKILLITGSVKKETRQQIMREFSPKANTEEDEDVPENEADILVSTEVLAEGQNLQDCNYVINYDLPWNPMRIVQRIGRVDRLTSTYETVRSRECFPDTKLDELLTLVGGLMDKIEDINNTVGLDTDLLGQEASPKQFNEVTHKRILAFAKGDGVDAVAGDIERESDLMPAKSPINEISRHIRNTGIATMEEFAMGRRSGKHGEGQRVALAYVREKPQRRFYSVMYDYARREATVVNDMEVIELAMCREGTPRHLPMDGIGNRESFEELIEIDAVAREAVATQDNRDHSIAREIKSNSSKQYNEIVERLRDIIDNAVDGGRLPGTEGESVDRILDLADLRAWLGDVESLLDEYDVGKDVRILAEGLKRIGNNIGVEDSEGGDDATEGEPGELVLVGAMFITGDMFDAKLGLSGIEQFT